ncbi:DUF397 domain-containing protein [Streptomyces sp. SID3343]|nr:DUF397 domain-containing protein [Streptomyces sp. SID3343]
MNNDHAWPWRTSSYSAATNENSCVEVAPLATAEATAVRDTKRRTGGHLCVAAGSWATLVTSLKNATAGH